jgi:hypothetical protein
METKKYLEMQFLSDSKPMMLESIRLSKRLPALQEILERFSTLEVQRIYNKLFNKLERHFLQERYAKQGLAESFKTKYDFEKLPENWFREND